MNFDDCKTLSDIAKVLNTERGLSDEAGYYDALQRIGAVDTGDDVYWAFRYLGDGRYERLGLPDWAFVVDIVETCDVPESLIRKQ